MRGSQAARGRKLEAPTGRDTRPTTDRVKREHIQHHPVRTSRPGCAGSVCGFRPNGHRMPFWGTKSCTFVEMDPKAQQVVRRNIEATGFSKTKPPDTGDAFGAAPAEWEPLCLILLTRPWRRVLNRR